MKQFIRRAVVLVASLGVFLSIQHATPINDLAPVLQPKIIDQRERTCLADVIYWEAGNQSFEGKKAVAFVVLNRTKKARLSICGVTHQIVGGQKQFPPVFMHLKVNQKQYKPCDVLAEQMLRYPDLYRDNTQEALYFHAVYVSPRWESLTKTVEIGDHIFYR
jgi:N-acetylmuramoyl-L-alanine amidase